MTRYLCLFGLGVSFLLPSPASPQDSDKPIRVLFVQNGHDPKPKAPILEKLMKDVGGFEVTPLTDVKKLSEVKRAAYDVLLCYGGPSKDELQERAIEKFVEEGGGVVALHHASANPSKAWIQLIGGSFAGHIAGTHKLNVIFTDVKHPVTAGVEPFEIVDEEYKHKLADVQRTVLAKFKERPPGSDPKANMDIIWVREVGKGRVLYNALGHGKEAWENPAWQKITLQGICWATGRPKAIQLPAAK
jgi:hypothetical protein